MIALSQINPVDIALQANGSVTISGQTAAHLARAQVGVFDGPSLMPKNSGCVNEGCSAGSSNSRCTNVLCS